MAIKNLFKECKKFRREEFLKHRAYQKRIPGFQALVA
jgi:hypothetical protein